MGSDGYISLSWRTFCRPNFGDHTRKKQGGNLADSPAVRRRAGLFRQPPPPLLSPPATRLHHGFLRLSCRRRQARRMGAQVAPWRIALNGKLRIDPPSLPTRAEMEDLWIWLSPVDTEPVQWTLVLEALELLDLLVRVDPYIGWEVIFGSSLVDWAFNLDEEAQFRHERVRPRFALDCIDSAMVEANLVTTFNALQLMLGFEIESWPPPSSGFARVKQELLDKWARLHGGRAFDRAREGRVEVMPRFMFRTDLNQDNVVYMLKRMCLLARDTQVLLPDARPRTQLSNPSSRETGESIEEQEARQRRAVFCFVAMNVEFFYHRLTHFTIRCVKTLMAQLPVRHLALDQAIMSELRLETVAKFLLRAFGVTGCGVTKFEFSSGCFDLAIVPAVCSALVDSPNVSTFAFTRSLSADDPNDDRPGRSVWWP